MPAILLLDIANGLFHYIEFRGPSDRLNPPIDHVSPEILLNIDRTMEVKYSKPPEVDPSLNLHPIISLKLYKMVNHKVPHFQVSHPGHEATKNRLYFLGSFIISSVYELRSYFEYKLFFVGYF